MPRFTIRNLLIGTAWFAVWGTLLVNSRRIAIESPVYDFPLGVALVILPFTAIGAIVGSTKGGAIFGVCATLMLIAFSGLVIGVVVQLTRMLGG